MEVRRLMLVVGARENVDVTVQEAGTLLCTCVDWSQNATVKRNCTVNLSRNIVIAHLDWYQIAVAQRR